MLKNIWKWSLRTFALICLSITTYLIAGEYLGQVTINQDFVADPNGVEIFVISNNIHTDIIVPTVTDQIDWSSDFPPSQFTPAPDGVPRYIAFGWGEKNLYENVPTWDDLTVPIFVNSMFIPSQSAMHVTYFPNRPVESQLVKSVSISPKQYEILIGEIQNEFNYAEDGSPIPLDCCWYAHISDNFYASPRYYHVFRTCNNWTNRTLRRTGVPTALWTPFPENILIHIPDA